MKIFLGRQSIYNIDKKNVAYEILYRSSLNNSFDNNTGHEEATYKVIQNILSFGLETLTNNKIAFINFPEDAINSNMATLLPKEKVIIEVLETVKPTKEVIKNLRLLKNRGYLIALDDVSKYSQVEKFLGVIDIIKIDYQLSDKFERFNIFQKLSDNNINIKMLAEKIETEEELQEARLLGFDYFQGYYFSKPVVMQDEELSSKNGTIFKIIIELLKEDFNIDRMENLIKSDVGLAYKFLKFINSAYFNFIQEVSSIKNAVALVGRHELRKWLSIISISEMNTKTGNDHTNTIIIRARMCEIISEFKMPSSENVAFMLGLFSDIHLLVNKPLNKSIALLPLNIEVKNALLGKDNIYKDILSLVIAYENMNEENIENIAKKLNIDMQILSDMYLAAIEWGSNVSDINI
ncbi:MAG: EAL and HDOD domain-containing protein [Clostridium sp.]